MVDNDGLTAVEAVTLDQRRRQAWDLVRLRGYSYREAGAQLGVSYQTISNDLRAVEAAEVAEWRDNAIGVVNLHVLMYRRAANEAWCEWEKSVGRVEEMRSVKKTNNGAEESRLMQKEMLGAVAYLKEYRSQLQAIERLIPGAIAPQRQEVDVSVIDRLVQEDLDRATAHMTPEQAAAYLAEVASGDGGE